MPCHGARTASVAAGPADGHQAVPSIVGVAVNAVEGEVAVGVVGGRVHGVVAGQGEVFRDFGAGVAAAAGESETIRKLAPSRFHLSTPFHLPLIPPWLCAIFPLFTARLVSLAPSSRDSPT